MALRRILLPLVFVAVCCSCQEKKCEPCTVKTTAIPSNWVIKITADGNGQCVQQAQVNGGAWTNYPTYVPVKNGDLIQWISISNSSGNKTVFFSPSGTPDFPGTPMYDRAGNPVRSFAFPSTGANARLTSAEAPSFDFPYTQVLIPDGGKMTPCSYPNPDQGMGVHVDN